MNLPNVIPGIPTVQAPQIPTPPPMLTTPSAVANLNCVGCGGQVPTLGEISSGGGMPLWAKILIGVAFVGGVFGLVMLAQRPRLGLNGFNGNINDYDDDEDGTDDDDGASDAVH